MILDVKDKILEAYTSETFKELSFGIQEQDMTHIIMLLREKMYRYPIDAICREVASNARDANRENGVGKTPIRIVVTENPYLKGCCLNFEDDGPGISPERMQDVFMNYGASTKRDSNTQTGGFGLGAKSPFAYTSSFTVETTHKGIKYVYMAAVQDGNRGRMVLLHQEPSPLLATGTKVAVPVEPEDITAFENACLTYTSMWDPVPQYVNFTNKDERGNYTVMMEKDNVLLVKEHSKDGSVNILKGATIGLLLDGIPYPVDDFNDEFKRFREKLNPLFVKDDMASYLLFKCNVGDVSITPNRESLHYDENTKNFLSSTLSIFINGLGKLIKTYEGYYRYPYSNLVLRGNLSDYDSALSAAFTEDLTKSQAINLKSLISMYEAYHGEYSIAGKDLCSLFTKTIFLEWCIHTDGVSCSGTERVCSSLGSIRSLGDLLTLHYCYAPDRPFIIMDLKSVSRPRNLSILRDYKGEAVMVRNREGEFNPDALVAVMDTLKIPYIKYSSLRRSPESGKVPREKGLKAYVGFYNSKNVFEFVRRTITLKDDSSSVLEIKDTNGNTHTFDSSRVALLYMNYLYKRDLHYAEIKAKDTALINTMSDYKPVIVIALNKNYKKLMERYNLGSNIRYSLTKKELRDLSKIRAVSRINSAIPFLRYKNLIEHLRLPLASRAYAVYRDLTNYVTDLPRALKEISYFGGTHPIFAHAQKISNVLIGELHEKYPLMEYVPVDGSGYPDKRIPAMVEYIKLVNSKEDKHGY